MSLGYFDPEITDYRSNTFSERLEVVSLAGDIASKEGEPVVRGHITLGRENSCPAPAHLAKTVDSEAGLALIDTSD